MYMQYVSISGIMLGRILSISHTIPSFKAFLCVNPTFSLMAEKRCNCFHLERNIQRLSVKMAHNKETLSKKITMEGTTSKCEKYIQQRSTYLEKKNNLRHYYKYVSQQVFIAIV